MAASLRKPTKRLIKTSPGVIGDKIRYNPKESARWVRDNFYPGVPLSQVRVSDIEKLADLDPQNVDEVKPRFFGGTQEAAANNERLIDAKINSYLGQADEYTTRGLPDGTCIDGFVVDYK